jgi:osmotically-inducible protein OsmY
MSLSRILFALLIVLGLYMPSMSQAMKGGKFDDQILQDVQKQINGKKDFKDVTASVDDQIVTLTGTVNVYIDLVNLEKRIKKVKNVEAVRNHVTVSSTAPDAELQEKLASKLRYDRVGYGNVFNALGLQVKDGVVTISGNVHDYPSRDSALAIAETMPGVKDVIDNIEVAPVSNFDDDLRLRLYRAIYGDPSLSKYAMDPQKPIRIVVDNGHVTLYGVVISDLDKQLAGTRANGVSGAFSVDNQLVVAK